MKSVKTARLILTATLIIFIYASRASADGSALSYRGMPDLAATTAWDEAAWGKNPFTVRLGEPGQRQDMPLTLSAIFYNPQRPSAIINERIVYIGNEIEGQKIVDIGKTHVILQWKGRKKRLDINSGPSAPGQGTARR